MRLRASGVVPIHGLNYRDRPEDAAGWLDELGDPYTRTGADRNGRVGIDWGVYGVPEPLDRKSVVSGKVVSGRVDLGGRRIIKKKRKYRTEHSIQVHRQTI